MKSILIKLKSLFIISLLLLQGGRLISQPETIPDKTESPYFFVQSDDPDAEALPLKSTSAEVNIAGVIADVKVKQVYKNEGTKPIEAIYVFPGSTRAAVYVAPPAPAAFSMVGTRSMLLTSSVRSEGAIFPGQLNRIGVRVPPS